MGSRESELRTIVSDLRVGPCFLGTFDKRFPGFVSPDKPACAIVNTAGRESGGMHWLAMAWSPTSRTFYMFDPFGFSDAQLRRQFSFEYERLLRHSAIASTPDRCVNLVRSTQAVQGPHSAACGLFCCLFLAAFVERPDAAMTAPPVDMLDGVSPARLRDPSSQPALLRNQLKLYSFLRERSPFFRRNESCIRRNTAFDYARPQ